jgi:hypothetical protein
MKKLWVAVLVGLGLVSTISSAMAQQSSRDYGGTEREYGGRSYDGRDNGGYDRSYDDDDDRLGERGRRYDNGHSGERGPRHDEERDRQRGHRYDDDHGRERSRGSQEEPEGEFDEDEYLRCNPDVAQAVERGQMPSGNFHYRTFGRREGRRLTCATKL